MDPRKIEPQTPSKPKAFSDLVGLLLLVVTFGLFGARIGPPKRKNPNTINLAILRSREPFWGWWVKTWPFWKVEILGDFQIGYKKITAAESPGIPKFPLVGIESPPKCLVTRPGFRQLSLHHGTHQPQHAVIIWIDAQIVSPLLRAYKTRPQSDGGKHTCLTLDVVEATTIL